MDMLRRYPYVVRNAAEYFDDIQDAKITKDMLELAKHIVEQKSGRFEPETFEDHYEQALSATARPEAKGPCDCGRPETGTGNVFNLMDALKQSIEGDKAKPVTKPTKAKKAPAKRLTEINRSVHGRRRPRPSSASRSASSGLHLASARGDALPLNLAIDDDDLPTLPGQALSHQGPSDTSADDQGLK